MPMSLRSRLRAITLVTLLFSILTLAPAMASPLADCANCASGRVYGTTGWSGSYRVTMPGVGERYVYCVEPGKWYAQGNYARVNTRTDDVGRRLGYLIWRWGAGGDADRSAAVSMLASRHAAGDLSQWNSFPGLHGVAESLWADSAANAGPYAVGDASLTQQPSLANGWRFVADFPVLAGGGVAPSFEFPGDLTQMVGAANVRDVALTRTGSASFRLAGVVADPASAWTVGLRLVNNPHGVDLWRSDVAMAQDVIGYATAPAGEARVIGAAGVTFVPQLRTQTSAQLVAPGSPVHDTVVVSGGLAGAAFAGSTDLYGPFASNDAALQSPVDALTSVATRRFSGTYGADGTATVVTEPVTVAKPGHYVWVEHLDASPFHGPVQPDAARRVTETTAVLSPAITSQISAARIGDGDVLHDTVTVTGLASTVGAAPITWTLNGALHGPVAVGPDGTCATSTWSGAPVGQPVTQQIAPAEITADGVASLVDLASATVSAQGVARCVSWAWSLSGQAADGSTLTVQHAPGLPTQTAVITYNPTITTAVQEQIISTLPASLIDRVTISGGVAGLPYVGHTSLYGPFATDDEAQTTDVTSLTPVAVREFQGVFDETGGATFAVEAADVHEAGFYVWIEQLDETASGGLADHADLSARATETTLVTDASVSTQVSAQQASRGSTLTDSVLLAGLQPTIGGRPVTWSVDVTLHGPLAPNAQGTCSDLDWNTAPTALSETTDLDADVVQAGTATLTGVGAHDLETYGLAACYTYAERLTATATDGSSIVVTHEPGLVEQTAFVPFAGQIASGDTPVLPALTGGPMTAISAGLLFAGFAGLLVTRRP